MLEAGSGSMQDEPDAINQHAVAIESSTLKLLVLLIPVLYSVLHSHNNTFLYMVRWWQSRTGTAEKISIFVRPPFVYFAWIQSQNRDLFFKDNYRMGVRNFDKFRVLSQPICMENFDMNLPSVFG